MAAKGKKPASRGKPRASASATKKKAAAVKAKPKAKAKAKPAAKKPKAKAKPAARKREVEVIEPMASLANAPDFVEIPIIVDDDDGADDVGAEDTAAGKKPSALARLKSGVGNLFAKMTRRGAKGAADESDGVPDAPTMDIVTGDIIGSAPVKTKRSRKSPPAPPVPPQSADED